MRYTSIARAAIVLSLIVCVPGACLAQKAQDLRGLWAGFTQVVNPKGIVEPEDLGLASIRFTGQDGRRLKGMIVSGVISPEDVPVAGVVAASGVLTLTGKVRENQKLVITGKVRELALDQVLIALRFDLVGPSKSIRGVLIALRAIGGGSPEPGENVTGLWQGSLQSLIDPEDFPVVGYLENVKDTTALTGEATIDGMPLAGSLPNIVLELRGAIVQDGSVKFDVGLLGADLRTGAAGILIGLRKAATPDLIQGNYMMFPSLFDVFRGAFYGIDTSADEGTFLLTQPPPLPSD